MGVLPCWTALHVIEMGSYLVKSRPKSSSFFSCPCISTRYGMANEAWFMHLEVTTLQAAAVSERAGSLLSVLQGVVHNFSSAAAAIVCMLDMAAYRLLSEATHCGLSGHGP